MRQEELDFLEDYCFNDLYKDLEIPVSKVILWAGTRPFSVNSDWFENEEELKEYMKAALEKRKLYFESIKNGETDLDYFDSFLPGAARYDYLGEFLGERNVYMKSLLSYNQSELEATYISIETRDDEGGYLKMLKKTDDGYVWHDYITLKSLEELYSEFEHAGIVLESSKEGKVFSLKK